MIGVVNIRGEFMIEVGGPSLPQARTLWHGTVSFEHVNGEAMGVLRIDNRRFEMPDDLPVGQIVSWAASVVGGYGAAMGEIEDLRRQLAGARKALAESWPKP